MFVPIFNICVCLNVLVAIPAIPLVSAHTSYFKHKMLATYM